MQNFLIITNRLKDPDFTVTRRIKQYLEKRGKDCRELTEPVVNYAVKEDKLSDADCILVLGGDGTLLQAAVDMAEFGIPFLGINMGTVGFLAEVDQADIKEALNRLISGEFEVEYRMMISGTVMEKNTLKEHLQALNDIVLTGRHAMQLMSFNIFVNGQLLNKYQADGMIISTPTGSTGYNLSAGGPIVEPKAETILLTPLCQHTLNSRSLVLSAEDKIVIEVDKGKYGTKQEAVVIFDGSHRVSVCSGDRIEIKKSEKRTAIIKLNQVSFLDILHKKIAD